MKRKILAIALITVCISLLAGGSVAFFTSSDTARNVITAGSVGIEIDEKFSEEDTWNRTTSDEGTVVYTLEEKIMPGDNLQKEPVIKNTGNEDIYVRVEVTLQTTSAEGEDLVGYIYPNLYALQWEEDPAMLSAYLADPFGETIKTTHKDWCLMLEDDSAWLVYKGVLKPGDELPIFDHVEIDPDMTNEFQGCTCEITVRAQAVQAKNNAPEVEGDYTTIKGWPAA